MSQPDETHACAFCGYEHPRRVACRFPEPIPDRTCPGCEGDGRCHCDECPGAHDSCEWCDGAGTYDPAARPASPAGVSACLTTENPGPAGCFLR